MESEGCNNGTTPQEQQMEAPQSEGNEGRANTEQQPMTMKDVMVNLRCEGMPISVKMVILRASQMDERFCQKRMQTKYSVVR